VSSQIIERSMTDRFVSGPSGESKIESNSPPDENQSASGSHVPATTSSYWSQLTMPPPAYAYSHAQAQAFQQNISHQQAAYLQAQQMNAGYQGIPVIEQTWARANNLVNNFNRSRLSADITCFLRFSGNYP
jgi:hypothetical protein